MGSAGLAVVTGGAGFIGSHIAAKFASMGARVRVIDDLSTGHRENLEEIGGTLDFTEASLADEGATRRVLEASHQNGFSPRLSIHRPYTRLLWHIVRGSKTNCLAVGIGGVTKAVTEEIEGQNNQNHGNDRGH